MSLPTKEIVLKTFGEVFPDFTSFGKIVTLVKAEDTSDYTDDSKMFSDWTSIYNTLKREYGKRLLRWETEEFENYLVNMLLSGLPNLYAKQMLLVENNLTKLKNKAGVINKLRNRNAKSSNPTTDVISTEGEIEVAGKGIDNSAYTEVETELTPIQQAVLFSKSQIRNALFEFVASLNHLFVSLANEKLLRTQYTPILRLETYEEVVTRILNGGKVDMKASGLKYFDNKGKFDADSKIGAIGYTEGYSANTHMIMLKESTGVLEFHSWLEIKAYIDAKYNDLQNQINAIKNNTHAIKFYSRSATFVEPADPNAIGSINIELPEVKDMLDNQMIELEVDTHLIKPTDNSQLYVITDANAGTFERLAFKDGDVASWDEVKDKITDYNMFIEKVGQYFFIRGWTLKGKANLPIKDLTSLSTEKDIYNAISKGDFVILTIDNGKGGTQRVAGVVGAKSGHIADITTIQKISVSQAELIRIQLRPTVETRPLGVIDRIKVAKPVEDGDSANKKYVDDEVSALKTIEKLAVGKADGDYIIKITGGALSIVDAGNAGGGIV